MVGKGVLVCDTTSLRNKGLTMWQLTAWLSGLTTLAIKNWGVELWCKTNTVRCAQSRAQGKDRVQWLCTCVGRWSFVFERGITRSNSVLLATWFSTVSIFLDRIVLACTLSAFSVGSEMVNAHSLRTSTCCKRTPKKFFKLFRVTRSAGFLSSGIIHFWNVTNFLSCLSVYRGMCSYAYGHWKVWRLADCHFATRAQADQTCPSLKGFRL